MQSKAPVVFLEDWLRSSTTTTTTTTNNSGALPPPSSARAILQAWSDLRDPSILSHPHRLLSSLQTLSSHSPSSLHLADSHAKLLLSLLSAPPSLLPTPSLPLLLRLLSTWLRKSPFPSPSLLQSTLSLSLLSAPSPPFPSLSILLLGALSAANSLPDPSRRTTLDLLCRILDEDRPALASSPDLLPETLAGIGYALSRCPDDYFSRIFSSLLAIWDAGGRAGPRPSLASGLMVLRLVEWVVSGYINSASLNRIESLCGELLKFEQKRYARFAVVMASAGVLRAFRLSSSGLNPKLKNSLEETIAHVAEYAVSGNSDENSLLLQCISLGLARCGPIAFRAPVFSCLCSALLHEIFPLKCFFRRAVENSSIELDKVQEHLGSILFREAGAVSGVFCSQYALADDEHKVTAENCIWEYSGEVYLGLREVAFVHRGKRDELIGDLLKIAEAAFLMVVVFSAEVSKYRLEPKSSPEIRPEVSVKILVAFSCVEFLRRVRFPEYTDAVRHTVLTIQENAAACTLFVESMPPYDEVTNPQGLFTMEGMRYVWWQDDVQTAHILFYLRVIPTCISLVPASMFGKLVAPTMFLYMQHPNEKVARASHSVFVAFVSSGNDSEQDERLALKEKLVFYYIQRALEAYPGVTPFEGLSSGIAALVRHLPAGSPAIFYCVHSLVRKATDLCRKSMSEDATIWKNWEGSSEPCKKVLDLLLRLIALVDIQVLPYLLKQLAEFVIQLPKEGQNILLDDMYSQVAESDDVTRKPVLVSWLQSLSYLSSQKNGPRVEKDGNAGVDVASALSINDGPLGLNRTSARL